LYSWLCVAFKVPDKEVKMPGQHVPQPASQPPLPPDPAKPASRPRLEARPKVRYHGALFIGIDWSGKKHDIAFVNEQGGVVERFVIEHSEEGFRQLDAKRCQIGVALADCWVGIEIRDNLLVDFLWALGYARLYILPPAQVAANRNRRRLSNANNDRFDATVIAETLRTDWRQLRPFGPGSDLLQQMRILVKQGLSDTQEVTRLANRLSDRLNRYYPAARYTFKSWPTKTVCHLLCAYPTPEAAHTLDFETFEAFAHTHNYKRTHELRRCFERLQASYPAAPAALVAVYQHATVCDAQLLLWNLDRQAQNRRQLQQLFTTHPDHHIFASLPGAGEWLAPALLVMLGEDRRRFPTHEHLQALAGTCPVTRQSGPSRTILFRRACDHNFRHIAQQWARSAVGESAWVKAYYTELRCRHPENDTLRRVANRLLAILWRIWQDDVTYDEQIHLQNRLKHRQRQP
jgi:transposase